MGSVVTNIEATGSISSVCAPVKDTNQRESGLIFAAGEQEKIMCFFVPFLGKQQSDFVTPFSLNLEPQ